MARLDRQLEAADEAQLDAADLARLACFHPDRRTAIACLLSAGEGWREAVLASGGAFVPTERTRPGSERKA